ncbi:Crp/Fnr family transcriptional regulator [Cytophagaceae bacterium YF14B1]|uniref:Crp/Fnr family transcriptional regulator n=1 Tax=Xanthocytophaga flava TaxID=3048013 RepID=A0AAE3QMB4_9BACT|nr:Crp/Fnr family transcriptional regulator [Xanthocytophaga flavus]MDJ1481977.1 Crp/Fnr family transcriptional regulator [Xanthocytophaga flavus]
MFEKLRQLTGIPTNELPFEWQTEQVNYKKGAMITRQGEVEQFIYWIKEGSVKVSAFVDIKEFILDFWFADDLFTSFASLIEQTPSQTQITALTDVIAERVSYTQLQQVYKQSHQGSEIGRKMAERMYVHKTRKEIELLTLTAEQRYEKLLEQSRRLILEIPVKDVASYLGILPESLSRIRRKVIS